MNNKKIFLILFAIVVLGASLRFYKLGQQSFVTDEFLDINAVYGYFKTGEWVAWDFNLNKVSDNLYAPRDERAWPYRIQVAQMFHFFPLTEETARSVSVLWGVFSIIILYFVSVYFTKNKTIGLISAFLFAVSIAGVTFDRMLRMYAMFFPIFLLFSWFTFRFLEEEYEGKIDFIKLIWRKLGINLKWFLPATLSGLLSFSLHPLTLNMGVIFILYLIVQVGLNFYQKGLRLNKYVSLILLLLFGLGVAYINNPKIYSFYSKENPIVFNHARWQYFPGAVSDYSIGLFSYLLIVFGLYGIWKSRELSKKAIWLGSCFFGILLAAMFLWNEVYGLRFIFFAMSFGIILLASGIFYLAESARKYFPKYRAKIFASTIIILLLIIPNYIYFFSKESPYNKIKGKNNYREAFGYFIQNKNANDALLTRNFRSFYYKNSKTKIISKEFNKRVSLVDLKKIITENPNGWLVSGDPKGDLEKDALKYIEEISTDKKEISSVWVYRWGK